jgi:hypothetical protein
VSCSTVITGIIFSREFAVRISKIGSAIGVNPDDGIQKMRTRAPNKGDNSMLPQSTIHTTHINKFGAKKHT